MDRIDRKLLSLLQQDATLSLAQLAKEVGLSATPCWKRIQRLDATGIIQRRVAILDPEKVGLGLTVFVTIRAADHSPAWLDRFTQFVTTAPEIVQAHRMAGDIDYMLCVMATDLAAYDAFYKRLITAVAPKDVSSHMSMERVKFTTAFPLPEAGRVATKAVK